jgi:hypothetical protein
VLLLAVAAAGAACGKRGAPLAPIVRIPAAVETIAASRFGNDVYVTLTVPATNVDATVPVDISRVDVFGYTGLVPPPRARFAELGELVATIPVAPPPLPGREAAGPLPARAPADGALPGAPVTIRDSLSPDELVQGRVIAPAFEPEPSVPIPTPVVTREPALRRFYLAVPFSPRGRPGPPGGQAELVLTTLPDPPGEVRVTYTAANVAIAWEPSGGLLGFLLDRSLPPEPEPFYGVQAPAAPGPAIVDRSVPPGPTTYNVYRELAPDPLVLPPAAGTPEWSALTPQALNPAPLAVTAATDEVLFDRERCYTVRAQRGMVLSAPSPPTCVVPIDVFPPAAPAGLAAVPSEGGISLIWEPVGDPDLGGYLVLRREAGDATLRQMTDAPIVDARYRDTDVTPGTRYFYTVVAVDTRLPLPNMSAASEPVEETAR